MSGLSEDFSEELSPEWHRQIIGHGALERSDGLLRLVNTDTTPDRYTNAQIDDYGRLAPALEGGRFRRHPPLRLTVRARFSHGARRMSGTAGFGFWNDPFPMTERRIPTLPRAIWFFFGSPPSDLKLDLDAPGHGWKAATIDALRPAAFMLAPLALPGALLMNAPPLYRKVWPLIQRALSIRETRLDEPMTDWHTYVIDWGRERSAFSVDGDVVLDNAPSPGGPLGFVMWLDNQYMVVKPWGRFKWGLLEAPGRQWMAVDWLTIRPP